MPSSPPAQSTRPVGADPSARTFSGDAALDSLLDAGALARLAELDPRGEGEFVRRVLTTFQTSAARLTGQLETAVSQGNAKGIYFVAHTLKSSAGYIGALDLLGRCVELEAATGIAGRAALPGEESFVPLQADVHAELDAMTTALGIALAAVSRRLNAR